MTMHYPDRPQLFDGRRASRGKPNPDTRQRDAGLFVRLSNDAREFIEREAKERDRSMAWIVNRMVEHVRETGANYTAKKSAGGRDA